MKAQYDFIIVGNNVASIVAAYALPEKCKIAFINPTPSWGAHFGGTVIDGERFDLGMNLLEFTSYNSKSDDLTTYNPKVKNDCGRFFHIIEKFITGIIDVHHVDVPKMYVAGQMLNDLIVSTDLSQLSQLKARRQMISELKEILASDIGWMHARNKIINEDLFLQADYATISKANHGPTFHNLFIEPFNKKVLNIGSGEMSALLHRVGWAPLIYPETLLAALQNEQIHLPKTVFHYPRAGYFSILVEELVRMTEAKENIDLSREKISQISADEVFSISLSTGEIISTANLIWTMDLGQYLKLVKDFDSEPFDKTSIAVIFMEVTAEALKKKISTVTLIDPEYALYRVTNQTYCAGLNTPTFKLVAEINVDYLFAQTGQEFTEEALAEYAMKCMIAMGFVDGKSAFVKIKSKILRKALNLPTVENVNKFENLYGEVMKYSGRNPIFLGQSSGYVSTSLNDQIVQGLQIGKLY